MGSAAGLLLCGLPRRQSRGDPPWVATPLPSSPYKLPGQRCRKLWRIPTQLDSAHRGAQHLFWPATPRVQVSYAVEDRDPPLLREEVDKLIKRLG